MRLSVMLGVLVAALAPAALAAGQDPTLRLLSARPLTLRGDHFKAGERVLVVLHTPRPYTRTVTAGADGSFTVQFAAASMRCGRVHATAQGRSGSWATMGTRRAFCASESVHPPLLPVSKR